MTELNLTLDSNNIQAIVRAQLAPTIEAELKKLDFNSLIRSKLHETPKAKPDHWHMMMMGMSSRPVASLLDTAIQNAIEAEAKNYIETKMRENRPFLADAFAKMLRESERKLTRAFCKSMLDAVDGASWGFELDMKVTTKGDDDD